MLQDRPLKLSIALKTMLSDSGGLSPAGLPTIKSGAFKLNVNCPEGEVVVLLISEVHWLVAGFKYERFTELLAVKEFPLSVIAAPPDPEVGDIDSSGVTNE